MDIDKAEFLKLEYFVDEEVYLKTFDKEASLSITRTLLEKKRPHQQKMNKKVLMRFVDLVALR